jgi:hypothetical protein
MDACDYRGQTAQAVLQDCADKSGRNWFVYFDEVSDTYGLWYDKTSSPNYVCTLSFSNVDGDADNDLIWWMNPGSPVEVQDPGKIVSGVRAVYTGGEVFRHASDIGLTTATDFYIREQTAPSANTKTAAKATVMADRLLRDNDGEEISASFSVLLPSTKVGLVRAGMRAACRFAFFDPPYRDWTDWRILRLETAQDEPNPGWYNIKADVTPIPESCCEAEIPTPSGYYPPTGSQTSDADGNVCYFRAGLAIGTRPQPFYVGDFHFDNMQETDYDPPTPAVPTGWVDGPFGDSTNAVYCFVVGAGEITLHTKRIFANGGYGSRTYTAEVWHEDTEVPGGPWAPCQTRSGISVGTDTTLTIDPCGESDPTAANPDGYCYHFVIMRTLDPASPGAPGHGGFAGFTWAAEAE